ARQPRLASSARRRSQSITRVSEGGTESPRGSGLDWNGFRGGSGWRGHVANPDRHRLVAEADPRQRPDGRERDDAVQVGGPEQAFEEKLLLGITASDSRDQINANLTLWRA